MPPPLLVSLCMIVRDEQDWLAGCLDSVRGLCDELVVVDTGSRDSTVALAGRAGARVVHFPWCDDFAAARNAGLQQARGEWVLVLDADERLAPGDAARLRTRLASADGPCGMVAIHNAADTTASPEAVLSGDARLGNPQLVPRLFRRTADLAFQGAVHESVRGWLSRNGGTTWDTGCALVHYGAVPSVRASKDKQARNVRLLEKRLLQEPGDFTVHGYLAHEHLRGGEPDKAWAVAEQGWALVLAASNDPLRSAARLASARSLLQLQRGDAAGMLATADQAMAYEGEGPDALFYKGLAQERLALAPGADVDALLVHAAQAYRACLGWAGRAGPPQFVGGATGWLGRTRLGTVLLLQGRPAEAQAAFDAALAEAPGTEEAQLGAAESLLESGRPAEALARLEPLLGSPARPDAALLAARVAEELGQLQDAQQLFALARSREKPGYLASHRVLQHVGMLASLLAYLGKPSAAVGSVGAVCGWMAGQRPTAPVRLPQRDSRNVRALVRNLLRAGHMAAVETLLVADAEQSLPGIHALVKEAVSALGMGLEEKA